MSSRISIQTLRFCTSSIDNLCTALDLLNKSYKRTSSVITLEGCEINIEGNIAFMRISSRASQKAALFRQINGKLAELEAQLRSHAIEENRREQKRARLEDEAYRIRKLKSAEEQIAYEKKQLELEQADFVQAKRSAIIAKAKEKGYSVQERVENGVVKLKLVKRIY